MNRRWNQQVSRVRRRTALAWAFAALAALAGPTVQAQLDTPLRIAAASAISNEFGVRLPGRAANPGALVMLLWASNGIAHPPNPDGTPHPLNPPVSNGTTQIGRSISPFATESGRFSLSLADPRPRGGTLFVRVFNRPTLEEASFYADSPLIALSAGKEFLVAIGQTTNPIDNADTDGDGLINSWEKSYGSDPSKPDSDSDGVSDSMEHETGTHPARADSDGDGASDGEELRAGTDPRNPADFFGIAGFALAGERMTIEWRSAEGRRYRLEGARDLTHDVFAPLAEWDVNGTNRTLTVELPPGLEGEPVHIFRVRLVDEPWKNE